jgi:hypothetical protein
MVSKQQSLFPSGPNASLVRGYQSADRSQNTSGGNSANSIALVEDATFAREYGERVRPQHRVVRATNGKLYGTTAFPSGTGNGALYDVTAGGVLTDIYNFPSTLNFDESANNMMQATNANLYGASYNGGTGASGGLYDQPRKIDGVRFRKSLPSPLPNRGLISLSRKIQGSLSQ